MDAGMDAGNTCNLTGAWALKVTATVSWAGTLVISAGTNQTVTFWALIQGTENGTTLSGTIVPCGIALPDFMSSIGGLTYGVTFPNSIFDGGHLTPVNASLTVSSTAPGATVTTAAEANLIGINLANPATAAWPNLMTAQTDQVDADADGNPGVTGIPKSGTPYSSIPVQIVPTAIYASQLYFALRSVISLNGTLNTCTNASGNATVSHLDNHIIGCRTMAADGGIGSLCTSTETTFADNNSPVLTTNSAKFTASMLTNAATCPNVRAALP
jgi:hypothetical protein